jgi:hypothetical protein
MHQLDLDSLGEALLQVSAAKMAVAGTEVDPWFREGSVHWKAKIESFARTVGSLARLAAARITSLTASIPVASWLY